MKAMNTRSTVVVMAAALLLTLPACGKKSLDKSVDKLVKAALANDYKAFKEMSHPELVEKFSADQFKGLSKSLNLLGKFKDRSMRGIKARSGKVREGRYKLTFEKGTVRLKITLRRGKMIAFRFTGDDLEKAMKELRVKAVSEFKVGSFKFLGKDDKGKNNVFKSGEKIRFKVIIHGMKRAGGNLKVQAGIRVVDTAGKVILANPKFVDQAVPIKADDLPVGYVSGSVTVPAAGHYKLQLRITDGHTGKSLNYTTALLVE